MSNTTTEIAYLSISSPGRNNHSLGSIISTGTITQQPQPDNVESTIPAPAPIRKWRWPKPSERRKKAVTLDTNTNTNTLPLPQTPSGWIWWNDSPQLASRGITPSSSSSQSQLLAAPDKSPPNSSTSPTLSLTEGFEKYWEDISDEEMITYIPPNTVKIWKCIIAQKRRHARAAGAEYERALEEELEEKHGAMLGYREEKNEAWSMEGLLEMVEECDLFGWVRERGMEAFWEGDRVEKMGDGKGNEGRKRWGS
ncbi:uncharacterized protein EAF02_001569 [Botrytis sinoallii]|uniref:uncharacterized protein n=1 Tax=Botrytis sinoallii TaxID=1463999 RepID=UPI00190119BF|nr:uncharacterized protein EAF02_001569 [Botrytis sinoallii]KAF7891244.1 hypothetical protein EAF02_001569 [Botrytis sinoallii]